MEFTLRELKLPDLSAIERLQAANPSASQWNAADYLAYRTTVAVAEERVIAFLAALPLPEGEVEILNLAVDPACKRQGVATALLKAVPERTLFLDVRISNLAAIAFYKKHGFVKTGHRRRYYTRPVEDSLMLTCRRR
jgi:ribosomal-protein-alanine N-acetyltransferase